MPPHFAEVNEGFIWGPAARHRAVALLDERFPLGAFWHDMEDGKKYTVYRARKLEANIVVGVVLLTKPTA